MVEHRNAAGLAGFFIEQGPRWCRAVQVVVSDGSKSYKAAIDAHLGHTRHVLDRFHVVRWFAQGLTLVRRDLQRRQPAGVKPAFDPDLFRARFALLQRADHLNKHDQARLDALFATHPRLRAGWQALQELYGLYLADDHDGAREALDRFTDLYATGQLGEFHHIVDTIIAWGDEILAWHSAGWPSNGRIEGTIIWSVSEGVVDVADGYVAGSGGRVIWIVSSVSAMLLWVCAGQSFFRLGPAGGDVVEVACEGAACGDAGDWC